MSKPTLIIAEAGVNHNGSVIRALEMVDAAVLAGADVVKFQTFVPELTVSASAQQAEYQKQNIGKTTSQLKMLQQLTLTFAEHRQVANYCRKQGIEYLSTAFDLESLEQLLEIGVMRLKIPSGEITHWPLLVASAKTGLPIILSTGMSSLEEIMAALQVLLDHGAQRQQITILHCNTQYPTPLEDANLNAMSAIASATGVAIGYSDHTLGIDVSTAAVAMGATVIEKHFTLDKSLPGPDHKASLDPQELSALVKGIRRIELIKGDGVKKVSASEAGNLHIARKYLVARQPIRAGEHFNEHNVIAKRIGFAGMSPMCWPDIIGKVAQRDLAVDEPLVLSDIGG
ncbi:N-acetylneuraminate synthase [Maribrevibacterium harenarium]|uniref:N-acetylneuraminate synthase n=1 Tax=Maribrevibacterium harenarium TaxID=2589817 RepID=A0A501X357_9GAMM|nr:N-acetylneuraminate synthase [Maribrevibacterium harenarium]TPE54909.1 N-acetylneuraminate synthase [Maribrevibacterium harenarium]